MRASTLISFFSIFFLLLTPMTPANAFDSHAFLKDLEAFVESDGAVFSYDKFEETGDGYLRLHWVKILDDNNDSQMEIGELGFKNPNPDDGSGFSYEALDATAIVITGDDGGKVRIANLTADGLEFANAPDSDPFPETIESLEFSNIKIIPPDSEGGSLSIPSINASGFQRTGFRSFILEAGELTSLSGRLFGDDGEPIDISSEGLTVRNLEHFGKFGAAIGELTVGAINVDAVTEKGPLSVTFDGMRIENYYAWDGIDEPRPMIPDSDITVDIYPLEVTLAGKPVFATEGGKAYADNDSPNQISTSTVNFKNMTLHLDAIPLEGKERRDLQPLRELGYEEISASISMGGFIDLKSGVLEIGKMELDITDAGSFDIKFRINGYTEEVARSIARLGRDIGNEPDPELQQAKSMQMLAMLTPLSLQDLEISVSDASLLNKVIGLQAARLNQEPDQVAGIVAPMAGIMMAPFNIPEFAASVSQALTVFMQGNKTMRARMKPNGGLAITEAIALGSAIQAGRIQPKELLDRLNVEVTAE